MNLRSHLFALILQLFALTGFTQAGSVSGTTVDAQDEQPLIGTHIVLKKGGKELAAVADHHGQFLFENVPAGTYELAVSYIGYQDYTRIIKVNNTRMEVGPILLKEGVDLAEVQVVEEVLPVIQLEDTTQFAAEAYKTMPDATAEELLEKMPTVVVDNGKVQAQGEDVKTVLVDGKPFFGNDPTAALRNIPAEVIDKIQIFDQQSDQANFTGFDDGETSKTINIITKPNMRTGQFGKFYAGYGYDDKYQAGGNINIFNDDQRISLIGLSNNINRQNFSAEDLLGVVGSAGQRRGGGRMGRGGGRRPGGGPQTGATTSDFLVPQQGGITAADALGINFNDKWGKKADFSASYFFNQSDNITTQSLTQQYFDAEGLAEFYTEESEAESKNTNHRFSGILDYKFNENNSLIWRSNLTWQGNEGQQIDLGRVTLSSIITSQSDNDFTADLAALNWNNSLLWRHKFAKRGRTLSINLNGGIAPKNGESYLLSDNIFAGDTSALQQVSTLDQQKWNLTTNVQYTEPLGGKSRLMLNYRASYRQEQNDKATYDFQESTQAYDLFNESLSNVFSNDYVSHSLGGGYNHNIGNWRLMGRISGQWAELVTDQSLPYEASTQHQFWNVLPMVRLSFRPSRGENLRIMYRTSTQLPNIEQLQNVIDNSNPLQLTSGNPTLLQGYQHSFFGRYTKTNTEKSSVFFAMLGGSISNNYIASHTYFSAADYDPSLEEDAQITVPVNLDGYYNLRSFLTYGFPLTAISSNLNIDLTANHTRTPGLINEELNYAKNTVAGIGLTLSSNISERVDFTLSSRSNYNLVGNSLQSESNTNFFNQATRLKLNCLLGSIIFRTDLTHQYYDGLEQSFDQNYLLWNMSIGRKLFKDDRGEINVTVFDLLNQNNALTRNVTETYTEDVQTNVLQQYLMVNFKFDLVAFKR